MKHIVVYDGTSYYPVPENELEDLQNEDEFGIEVIQEFTDIDVAFDYASRLNGN